MEPRSIKDAPYLLLSPEVQRAPIILTSPHSGRCYEPRFLQVSRLDPMALRRSEDSFVEELFGAGPALGIPMLAANFPRAWCDPNREAWELDPAMFVDELPDYVNSKSTRVHAGLGTIARVVGTDEPIYARKLYFAEAQARITECWQPFHDALNGLIESTVAQFGVCLVIDCHSMPSVNSRPHGRPDIVLGDSHGTSCDAAVTRLMQSEFSRLGLHMHRNDPYAGGYITRHYGQPRAGVHAVQIEVARALYMRERAYTKSQNFEPLQKKMGMFLASMVQAAGGLLPNQELSTAAE